MNKSYIICVDDEALITLSLKRELRARFPQYQVETALSGDDALKLMQDLAQEGRDPAVLITDECMPGMPGHELMIQACKLFPGMYTILLTGYTDIEALSRAINEAGLFRYMRKPWDREDLALSVKKAISLYQAEREVCYLKKQIEKLNISMVAALETSAHDGDPLTFYHVKRVAYFSTLLAHELGLPPLEVKKIRLYAPLHDIGKSGIPSDILFKPSRLSDEEFDIVKNHVDIGAQIIKNVEIDSLARDIILYHHERWDGSGYLCALQGEEIPVAARIVALADVLDAILCERPYKAANSFEEAYSYIVDSSGKHFDPELVNVFVKSEKEMRLVAQGDALTIADLDYLCEQFS